MRKGRVSLSYSPSCRARKHSQIVICSSRKSWCYQVFIKSTAKEWESRRMVWWEEGGREGWSCFEGESKKKLLQMRAFLSSDTFSLFDSARGNHVIFYLPRCPCMRYCRLLNFIRSIQCEIWELISSIYWQTNTQKKIHIFFFSMILELFHFDALKEYSREGCLFQLKFFLCVMLVCCKKVCQNASFFKRKKNCYSKEEKKNSFYKSCESDLPIIPLLSFTCVFFHSVVDEKNVFLIENMKKKKGRLGFLLHKKFYSL